MIRTVRDDRIWALMNGERVKRFPPDLVRRTQKRLLVLHLADRLSDLLEPPSNRLEALKGDRAGEYSIRINRQWRICFRWEEPYADDVEIVDYH